MKKIATLLISFIFLLTLYAEEPISKKKVQYICEYVRTEDFSQNDFWLTKLCSKPKEDVIVNSPESAAMLAYVYAKKIYGEHIAKGEQPYKISLVNDSIWCVSGSSKYYKNKKWRGNFIMVIDKNSGSLLAYMHEK